MNNKFLLAAAFATLFAVTVTAKIPEENDALVRELREVVVTANQPATKLVGSTLVTVIPGTNLADLGTAFDVLGQLPMLKVSDNSVSVIGKSNVEIYIDGRPMRDDSELRQLLSANIGRVELLMAPGAEYESTTGAVLKITTRRRFRQGLSVTDQFQLRRRRRWSAMDCLSLGYRIRNLEFFVDGTVNYDNSLITGLTKNSLLYDGKETEVGSTQRNSFPTATGVVKSGFNYSRGPQSFGAYWRYNPERGDFRNFGSEWTDNVEPVSREINRHVRSRSHLVSAYYENTFADRYLLHFDGDFPRAAASLRPIPNRSIPT